MSEEDKDKKAILEGMNKQVIACGMSPLTREELDELILKVTLLNTPAPQIVDAINKVKQLIEGEGFLPCTLKDAEEVKETLAKLVDNKHKN